MRKNWKMQPTRGFGGIAKHAVFDLVRRTPHCVHSIPQWIGR